MHSRSFRRGPSDSFRRPFGRRSAFGRRRPLGTTYIDPARFVNKAVITEEIEQFVPEHSFQDFKIESRLKHAIAGKGYPSPTPIQDRAIPHVLEGRDVVGIANTGTGKTAAFLIPLINKVILNPRERVMIIVPTRELALQIEDELRGFAKGMNIFSVSCVGGAPIGRQLAYLRRAHHFVIGTPGRLKDLIKRQALRPAEFKTAVLDEADRMLDMGFVNDMRMILAGMPAARQTLFFSATLSPDIEKLVSEFLREPVRISVKTRDTSKNVDQDVIRLRPGEDKVKALTDLLGRDGFDKILIFGRTKHGVERLSRTLLAAGFKAESIHGDKSQSKRQRALALFKSSHVRILVATDVAARGLDISGVSHVINYDLPATYEDYIHRIGRTGRANKMGTALTFIE